MRMANEAGGWRLRLYSLPKIYSRLTLTHYPQRGEGMKRRNFWQSLYISFPYESAHSWASQLRLMKSEGVKHEQDCRDE